MMNLRQTCETEIANTKLLDIEWENPRVYAEWLAQTYQFVSYSTRIIGLAACLFDQDRTELHHRFLEHVKEENHHELLLVNDLKSLGYSIEQFDACPSAKILFQNQYYWIQNVDPITVYGYFLYLETLSIAIGPKIYDRVIKAHPEKSTRFLKVHVGEDVDHVDVHYSFTDKLSILDQQMIQENLVQASTLYRNMLSEIIAQSQKQLFKKAS